MRILLLLFLKVITLMRKWFFTLHCRSLSIIFRIVFLRSMPVDYLWFQPVSLPNGWFLVGWYLQCTNLTALQGTPGKPWNSICRHALRRLQPFFCTSGRWVSALSRFMHGCLTDCELRKLFWRRFSIDICVVLYRSPTIGLCLINNFSWNTLVLLHNYIRTW